MPFATAPWSPHLVSISQHPSCSGKPRTGHGAPQSVSQMPNRGEGSFPDLLATLLSTQPRDAGDFLCCKGTLLAPTQIAVHELPQIPFGSTASQAAGPQSTPLHRVIPSHGQDLAFAFAQLCEAPVSPLPPPAQVPLNSSTALQHTDCCLQFDAIHKLAETALAPITHVINEDNKQCWPQYWIQTDLTS